MTTAREYGASDRGGGSEARQQAAALFHMTKLCEGASFPGSLTAVHEMLEGRAHDV